MLQNLHAPSFPWGIFLSIRQNGSIVRTEMKKPELLSPTQDMTSLTAALTAGADAVFFGVHGFNMRVTAKNFSKQDMEGVVNKVHDAGKKVYLALNTIIYDDEQPAMQAVLEEAKRVGVDAIICWDLSVVQYALQLKLPVHLSTQASVANSASAQFFKDMGVERIVLARECTLEQITHIKETVGVEVETFIHGAMCVSISGRCFMSQFSTCHSANRGECRQPCRRNYRITDTEGEYEFEVGKDYVLSAKDLCTLPFIERLVDAGIDCFKIEGRNKSAEYVKEVTSVYRDIIDFIWEHRDTRDTETFSNALAEKKEQHMSNLSRVFTRGFSNGFYLGKPVNEWTHAYGNVGTEKKVYIGKVLNVYKKAGEMEVKIETNETIQVGDELYLQGERTGSKRIQIHSMQKNNTSIESAKQGETVAIAVHTDVRRGDMVSKIELLQK